MTWFRLDDGSHDHPKVEAAGNAAWGLVCRLGAWSAQKLTDGFVPDSIVQRYGTAGQRQRAIDIGLVIVGTNDAPPDGRATPGPYGVGVWLHDFLDRNPTRAAVMADREGARVRQQRGRDSYDMSRRDIDRDIARSHTVSHGCPDPTRPDPTSTVKPPPPLTSLRADSPVGGGGDRFAETIEIAVDVEESREPGVIRNPTAWRRTVRQRVTNQHGPAITAAVTSGQTPTEAAATVLGITEFDLARIRLRGGYT